jgi:long-chain acyl-CoA synthetase
VVQLKPGERAAPDELRASLRKVLAGFKVPRDIDFASELPREDSGKIFKRKLRQPFWEGRSTNI